MKNFFVIGDKTSKSLSPLIFNHWFKLYNIRAKYSYVEVSKNNFEKVLFRKMNDNKTFGFNVTAPYKKEVYKYISIKNKDAKNIGAINCVKIQEKNKGINTDWIGYLNSIKGFKINKTKNILVLGYGGASKAIVYGFLNKGFKNIIVFNRSKKLISFNKKKTYTKKYNTIDGYLSKVDLIINTTPINPLSTKQTKGVGVNVVVSDIVYKPKNTTFLNSFEKNKKIYGISMLIQQAIPCFYEWFGFNPRVDKELIKKLNLKTK